MTKTGTREWAEHSFNCQVGCELGCLYCYAREQALRFGRIAGPREWTRPVFSDRRTILVAARKKYAGRVMFPTRHDITPLNLNWCMQVLEALLAAGNQILVVTKAHLDCVREVCALFNLHRDQLVFRFTIGTPFSEVLARWEPAAPTISERLQALRYAFCLGFRTSVSAEPLLAPWAVRRLVEEVSPLVRDTIWIGAANHLKRRMAWCNRSGRYDRQIADLLEWQTPAGIRSVARIVRRFKKVRFKESYRKVLGLPDYEGVA